MNLVHLGAGFIENQAKLDRLLIGQLELALHEVDVSLAVLLGTWESFSILSLGGSCGVFSGRCVCRIGAIPEYAQYSAARKHQCYVKGDGDARGAHRKSPAGRTST